MSEEDELWSYPYEGVRCHRHMSRQARAAQFAPFSALEGYEKEVTLAEFMQAGIGTFLPVHHVFSRGFTKTRRYMAYGHRAVQESGPYQTVSDYQGRAENPFELHLSGRPGMTGISS